ncbi:uncharacterized protein G2W53_021806 [Senna tora]|uniref:Uncharacterized protein n=1 Tax=Senna tora TaxID=362788 RepID=A0A834TK43_9FABA|nr:uncharacterized protein G2W53_021806 [Senna tora]
MAGKVVDRNPGVQKLGRRDVLVWLVQALAIDCDGERREQEQEHRTRCVCTHGGRDRICMVVVFMEAPRARREGSRATTRPQRLLHPSRGEQPELHTLNRVIRSLLMKAGHEYTQRGCERRLRKLTDCNDWINLKHNANVQD